MRLLISNNATEIKKKYIDGLEQDYSDDFVIDIMHVYNMWKVLLCTGMWNSSNICAEYLMEE